MNFKIKHYTHRGNLTPWLLSLAFVLQIISPQEANSQVKESITYADLVPILSQKCTLCHSGAAASRGLQLDSYDNILKGSERGPVVIAGEPSMSELIHRLKGISQPRMPLTGPPYLSDIQITLFERWIAAGMPKGGSTQTALPLASPPPLPTSGEFTTYQHVAPILAKYCVKCHADNGLMGSAPEGYRLTSYMTALSVSDRVRVIPGNPGASELLRRIRGQALPRMPFDGPPYLTESEVSLIENWIAQGARDTEGNPRAIPFGASVRLHGTLGPRWQLNGLELIINSNTRIDKSPRQGNYVEVRGQLNTDGDVVVERLRRR